MSTQIPLPRILIYQDEDCSTLAEYLEFYGFKVISTSEENVLGKLQEGYYDLCILGHFKANIPGDLRLLHFLRKISTEIPVIFISDLSDYPYIIEAFNKGADDYVVRPYNLEELICRINALLKRYNIKTRNIDSFYKIGDYEFDTKANTLTLNSLEIKLTIRESKVLALLCAYKDEILLKTLLLRMAWKDDNYFNKRSLDVHICHLRKYLSRDKRIKIDTVRNVGYALTVSDERD